MADEADDADKTEEPTPRRLEEAAKHGDLIKSSEVTTFVALSAGTLALALFGHSGAEAFARAFRVFLEQPDQLAVGPGGIMAIAQHAVWGLFLVIAAPLALLMGAGVAANVLQAAPVFTTEKIKPDISKLSLISGFKRLFGTEAVINLVKGMAKIGVVSAALWTVLWPERVRMTAVLQQGPRDIASGMVTIALKIALAALAVLAVIAIGDYLIQRFQFFKRNRMSRQEIKDEHRQSEGDPMVKAKVRQLRQERARRRMMAQVPQATVVIMNPTHYAVALKYESGQMAAPLCVAKGVDALALRIRDVAKEHGVAVIENPPLARALYAAVEVDEAVPPEHFKAVAQVIGYVMRLSGKLRAN